MLFLKSYHTWHARHSRGCNLFMFIYQNSYFFLGCFALPDRTFEPANMQHFLFLHVLLENLRKGSSVRWLVPKLINVIGARIL